MFAEYADKKGPILLLVGAFVSGFIISALFPLFYLPDKNAGEECPAQIEDLVTVEITGAVQKPGVYDLSEGSRVLDAVKTAGEFTEDYDFYWVSRNLNLSQIVKDEQKIFIPFEALGYISGQAGQLGCAKEIFADSSFSGNEASSGSTNNAGETNNDGQESGKVNVNSATFDELDALPGIGATYAGKIVSGRPYSGAEEFLEKSGLSDSVYEKIKDLIAF